jgi:phosphopantothenoylcysteine decarboxylase/phosphopantothenate--cysteine ligase
MAAAVSDYRPDTVAPGKIKRTDQATLTIDLIANPDILAGLGNVKAPGQVLAGFALESDGNEELAREKMNRKKCDLMVFNRVEASLGTDTTEMVILDSRGGCRRTGSVGKEIAARELFACILDGTGTVHG